MAETKTILVAGATGQQGGAVARSLVQRGHRVKGLTRSRAKFKDLRAIGSEGIEGDLTDRAGLASALRGVDGFFVVTTPFGQDFSVDPPKEIRQGTTAVDAAKAAGVRHVVLTSVASADEDTGIPHFESKAQVEQYLRRSGLRYTITRPVFFMDNYAGPRMVSAIGAGTLALPMAPDSRQQMVAVKDIGEIVARAFERAEMASGRTVELAGDELTMADVVDRLSKKLGHPIRYVELPEEEVRQRMGEDAVRMYRWFKAKGYHVDIDALERQWGYRMTRFDDYLRQVNFGP